MKRQIGSAFVTPVLFLLVAVPMTYGEALNVNQWVDAFTPLREIYVSPDGLDSHRAEDYSGNGFTGIHNDEPTRVPGVVPSPEGEPLAIRFKGFDSCITLEKDVAPWGSDVSIEAWIRTESAASPHVPYPIISNWGGASAGGHGQIFGVSAGRVAFAVSENAAAEDDFLELRGPLINDNQWHHVAVTIDQTDNVIMLYVDGALVASDNVAHIADSGAGINPMRYIGWSGGGNWPNIFYRGSIDELRVYNRVLSTADIALHHYGSLASLADHSEPSLVAGWHFDEVRARTPDNPTSLSAAGALVEPGDLVWLTQGVYSMGAFSLVRSGTVDNPIVFRAQPGARVTINGRIEIAANYNWLWGLEVTTADEVVDATAINIGGAGVRLINNYIHDNPGHANGIGDWNHPDQIIYGNIVFENGRGEDNPHNIYAQNTFAKNGYKFVVDNMFLDSSQVCGNCFNFHGYGECRECVPILTGFFLKGNAFKNGRFLIGGFNKKPSPEGPVLK